MFDLTYQFTAPLWRYPGEAAWYFITLPQAESEEIRRYTAHRRRGWGSLRVLATVGSTVWDTSIFPDRGLNAFLLPVKAAVRKAERLDDGMQVDLTLTIAADELG